MAGTRGVEAGKAFVRLGVLDETKKAFDAVKARALKTAKAVNNVANQITGMGAAITGPLAIATKVFAGFGDNIDKVALRTKLTTDEVQSLSFAFQQTGGSAASMESAIRKMRIQLQDLRNGLSTAKDNFRDLGLEQKDFEGLGTADSFRLIAESLNKIQDEGIKAGVALKMFGRAGGDVIAVADSVDELEKEFERLGIKLDGDLIKTAAELTDEFNRVYLTFMKFIAEIGAALGDDLIKFLEWVRETGVAVANFVKENKEMILAIGSLGAKLTALGAGLKVVGIGLTAIAAIANPFAAAIAGATILLTSMKEIQAISDGLVKSIAGKTEYEKRMESDAPGLREIANRVAAQRKAAEEQKRANAEYAASIEEQMRIDEEFERKQRLEQEASGPRMKTDPFGTKKAGGGMAVLGSALGAAIKAVGNRVKEAQLEIADTLRAEPLDTRMLMGLEGLSAGMESGEQREIVIQEAMLAALNRIDFKMDGNGVL